MRTQTILYLNDENEDENLIINYLKGKNKNATIKRALMNEIRGVGFKVNNNNNNNNINTDNDFEDSELDDMGDIMNM